MGGIWEILSSRASFRVSCVVSYLEDFKSTRELTGKATKLSLEVTVGWSVSGNLGRATDLIANVWKIFLISLVYIETLQKEAEEEDEPFSAFHFLFVSIFHNGLLVW